MFRFLLRNLEITIKRKKEKTQIKICKVVVLPLGVTGNMSGLWPEESQFDPGRGNGLRADSSESRALDSNSRGQRFESSSVHGRAGTVCKGLTFQARRLGYHCVKVRADASGSAKP